MYKFISFLTFVLVFFASLTILGLPANIYLSNYQIDIFNFWDFLFALRQIAEIGFFDVRVDVVCAIGWLFLSPLVSAGIAFGFSKQQPGQKRPRIHQRPGQYRLPAASNEELIDQELFAYKDLENSSNFPIDLSDMEVIDAGRQSAETAAPKEETRYEPSYEQMSKLPSFMDMDTPVEFAETGKTNSPEEMPEPSIADKPHLEAWMMEVEEEPASKDISEQDRQDAEIFANDPDEPDVSDESVFPEPVEADTGYDVKGAAQEDEARETDSNDAAENSSFEGKSPNAESQGNRVAGLLGSTSKFGQGLFSRLGRKATNNAQEKDDPKELNNVISQSPKLKEEMTNSKQMRHVDLSANAQLMRWYAVWVKTSPEDRSDMMRQEAFALANALGLFDEQSSGVQETEIISEHGMTGISVIRELKLACQQAQYAEEEISTESASTFTETPDHTEEGGLFDDSDANQGDIKVGSSEIEVKDVSADVDQWAEVASMFEEPETDEDDNEEETAPIVSSGSDLEELDSLWDAPKKKTVADRITGDDLPVCLSELSMIEAQLRVYTVNEDNYDLDDEEAKSDLWKQMDGLAKKIEKFKEESGEGEVRRIEFALKDKRQRWWFMEGVGKVRSSIGSKDSRIAFEEELVNKVDEEMIF